jgi:hypothetical protein
MPNIQNPTALIGRHEAAYAAYKSSMATWRVRCSVVPCGDSDDLSWIGSPIAQTFGQDKADALAEETARVDSTGQAEDEALSDLIKAIPSIRTTEDAVAMGAYLIAHGRSEPIDEFVLLHKTIAALAEALGTKLN